MSAASSASDKPRVVVAGGGIAGMEALLALADLAGDDVELVMVAPDPEFRYRPMAVDEPFSQAPYVRHELPGAVAELGGRFVKAGLRGVEPTEHTAALDDGSTLGYAALIVCIGARQRAAFEHAFTFTVPGPQLDVNDLLGRAGEGEARRLAFVVPSGVTWTLPLYELAMLTAKRRDDLEQTVEITLVTPETSPLAIFGSGPSAAVSELLSARGIECRCGVHVREVDESRLVLAPGDEELKVSGVVALPLLDGPAIEGLPSDQDGFIPIDQHARVIDVDDVYAAGDGTNFPLKQGGLGTQQADAAAEHVAASLGAGIEPAPFHPVLRGKLLVGEETMSMRADVAGGGGEGVASPDHLWWPPFKVSGRYLSPWLAGDTARVGEPAPPGRSIDVELALPLEWQREPMALDPYGTAE
jgi:sulfide:quinone oxidoreductase